MAMLSSSVCKESARFRLICKIEVIVEVKFDFTASVSRDLFEHNTGDWSAK